MAFADRLHASDVLPLRHGVHGIDMEQAGLAVFLALVHRVHAQVSWPTERIGLTPLANGDLPALRVLYPDTLAAAGLAVAEIVQMGYRDPAQALVFSLAKFLELAMQNAAQRRSRSIVVRRIGGGEKHDVFPPVVDGETRTIRGLARDLPVLHPLPDQTCQLRATGGSHFGQKLPRNGALGLAQLAVALRFQHRGDDRILGCDIFGLPGHLSTARKQVLHLAQD
jgi:hypothetical protein